MFGKDTLFVWTAHTILEYALRDGHPICLIFNHYFHRRQITGLDEVCDCTNDQTVTIHTADEDDVSQPLMLVYWQICFQKATLVTAIIEMRQDSMHDIHVCLICQVHRCSQRSHYKCWCLQSHC